MKTRRILMAWMFAVTMLAVGAWAQDYGSGPNGEAAPASDGPQPDVARISLIHGDVSSQRGDTGDWATTTINAPLVRGDQVATGEQSRAEIQLDYANIVRLAAKSQVKIADLTRTRIQIQVAQGFASYTQFKHSEAEAEIDSPNVSVRPLRAGRYRVQVNSESETDVIVREGEAEITTPQGSTRVKSGEMITVRGTDSPEYRVAEAPVKDDWDRWNKDRDNVIRQAEGWRRTNRYYTGANDLDAYGHWAWVPGYGNVWQPYYSDASWAPYQSGRWVWEPYYGWTWVSYEPWGWAPYHYGRWFYYGNNWCWWPGPVYVSYRPVWSPAFVFFVGFGHHSSFGFGSIGWFPVGPNDPFYPWYGRGFNRVNVVNITNVTNITNITNITNVNNVVQPLARRGREPYYSNARLALTNPHVRGSITSVSSEDFGRGGNNGRRHGVDEHELREGRVMTANLPVVPSRESLHAGNGGGGAPAGIQPRNSDHFYTRHQPPAGPESFHDQMERVQRVVGPQAVGANGSAQGNVRTDFHAGPGQVDRHDIGGANATAGGNARGNVNEKTGIAEVPRTGGSTSGGATGGAQGHVGNSAQDNPRDSRDRGSWTKFGPPQRAGDLGTGRSDQTNAPVIRSNDQGRVPRTDNAPVIRSNDQGRVPRTDNAPVIRSNDQGRVPRTDNGSPTTPDRGHDGWQKFPQNADHANTDHANNDRVNNDRVNNDRGARPSDLPANRNDRTDQVDRSSGSKPPLELHRPIVTPRADTNSGGRSTDRGYTPPSATRTPDVHNEPRYSPPPQRSEPRYSPPPSRSESRSSGGGGGSSHGGGGGSSSSHSDRGSSSSGSHGGGDSKSSSGPKPR